MAEIKNKNTTFIDDDSADILKDTVRLLFDEDFKGSANPSFVFRTLLLNMPEKEVFLQWAKELKASESERRRKKPSSE